jgi:hypothetical protein
VLSARIVLTLLEEAKGVPVIFAILLPSGNVVLEVIRTASPFCVRSPYLRHTAFIDVRNSRTPQHQ